jgi:hypothetical protein
VDTNGNIYKITGIIYNIPELKNYILTPEDFLSRKERQQLMKTCREHAELDLIKGLQTWAVRFMLVDP